MSQQTNRDDDAAQRVDEPNPKEKFDLPYDPEMTEGDEANAPDHSGKEDGGDEHASRRPSDER